MIRDVFSVYAEIVWNDEKLGGCCIIKKLSI